MLVSIVSPILQKNAQVESGGEGHPDQVGLQQIRSNVVHRLECGNRHDDRHHQRQDVEEGDHDGMGSEEKHRPREVQRQLHAVERQRVALLVKASIRPDEP